MIVKTDYQKRSVQAPLAYCMWEGATTFILPIGHVIGGGNVGSVLFLVYLLHGCASFCFHLFPSEITYWVDVCMINLLIMERVYTITGLVWIYPIYVTSMLMEPIKSYTYIIGRVMVFISIFSCLDIYDVCLWVVCLLTFIQSFYYAVRGHASKTTLTCCLYHLYLGILSALEVRHHKPTSATGFMTTLLRFCMYYVFVFYVVYNITDNPKRLRNVLTLLSAVVLTPLSFYEAWCQFLSPHHIYKDEIQIPMVLWFMAYAIVDLIVGSFFYPQYTTLLEAWVHHIGFLLTLSYYLLSNEQVVVFCCMSMVVETSTIILCLFKIFHDCDWILRIRDKHFVWMFCLFRMWFPTFFILYFYNLLVDNFTLSVYITNMVLNAYWLSKILTKKNPRNK